MKAVWFLAPVAPLCLAAPALADDAAVAVETGMLPGPVARRRIELERHTRRLIGFEKVDLAPGESRRVAHGRSAAGGGIRCRPARLGGGAGSYRVAVGTDAGTMTLAGGARLSAQTLKP